MGYRLFGEARGLFLMKLEEPPIRVRNYVIWFTCTTNGFVASMPEPGIKADAPITYDRIGSSKGT